VDNDKLKDGYVNFINILNLDDMYVKKMRVAQSGFCKAENV